ncbi:MAG: GIY-YIG nuclease family protein, partial [Dinghuibacter sp.]|nr:GIY-YIG nuclease family protein [Dinghuibacter sp.]
EGKVFVAHSVNFDFSFINAQLKHQGFELKTKKLCTVRYGKKVVPGLPSYSLGNFCRSLEIPIQNRHRAGGDCYATWQLFCRLLEEDRGDILAQFLKHGSKEKALPQHLDAAQINQLPYCAGVYYFHDRKGKIVYTGKATNIRKRVLSHFTNNGTGKQKQEFLRNIHTISFTETATELMAFILESVEIKRLWPRYNNAQKRGERRYGIYSYEDQNGFLRLGIDVRKKVTRPLYELYYLNDGYQLMHRLINEFELCPKWCFIDRRRKHEIPEGETCSCGGACTGSVPKKSYNKKVNEAIGSLNSELLSFCIVEKGLLNANRSCILVEQGQFYGMGYIDAGLKTASIALLKEQLEQLPGNPFINGLVHQYAAKNPGVVIVANERGGFVLG